MNGFVQDPSSELKDTTTNRRLIELKPPTEHNALQVPTGLRISQVKADVPLHRTFTTSNNLSHDKDSEYEKLIRRINQPRYIYSSQLLFQKVESIKVILS